MPFVTMHVRYNDGQSFDIILTKTNAARKIRECAQGINRVDGPTNAAQAIRDVMDEQTIAYRFHTFQVMFEIIPHYWKVIKYKDVYGTTQYKLAD